MSIKSSAEHDKKLHFLCSLFRKPTFGGERKPRCAAKNGRKRKRLLIWVAYVVTGHDFFSAGLERSVQVLSSGSRWREEPLVKDSIIMFSQMKTITLMISYNNARGRKEREREKERAIFIFH